VNFPAGWLEARRLSETFLHVDDSTEALVAQVAVFLEGHDEGLIPKIAEAGEPLSVENQLLQQDIDQLQDFFARMKAPLANVTT